jgi:hypothetical protein
MARRPEISVILISNEGIVRADFGKDKNQPSFRLREPVDVESSFSESVQQAFVGQPLPGHRTIVASTEVWSQMVLLPRMSIAGIEPEELEEALKFEAETLSGIEIDEISLAYNSIGKQDDHEQFWVSAIRKSDQNDINSLLQSLGCREIVIAHPAGLSGNTKSPKGEITVEFWDDLAFLLSDSSKRLLKVRQSSRDSLATEELLAKAESAIGFELSRFELPTSTRLVDLSDDQTFEFWASSIIPHALDRENQLSAPLIRKTKRQRGTPVRHLISGIIALAVLGFCFWHWNYTNTVNQKLVEEIESIQQPAKEKKLFDSQLISILEQRAEIERQDETFGDDLKRVRFFLDSQSGRIAELLKLLADQRTPDLVIEQISGSEEGLLISGISLNGESAQALAKRLRELATPLGWVVNPAKQEGQQKLTTGGPWNYEIVLTDSGPFDSAVQPRKKTVPMGKP